MQHFLPPDCELLIPILFPDETLYPATLFNQHFRNSENKFKTHDYAQDLLKYYYCCFCIRFYRM